MAVEPPEELQTPTLSQVIATALGVFQEDLHTCAWGTVVDYDSASQTASVQLPPRRWIDEEGVRQTESPAPLVGVRVIFPGSGPYSITFPVTAGDPVLVLFGEHAFDAAVSGQPDADSGDDRRHSLSDAVCVPGLRSKANVVVGPPPSDSVCVTAPKIQLSSKDATKGVARTGDDVKLSSALIGGIPIAKLQTILDTRYAVASPLSNLDLTQVIGTVASGSSKVKADD